MSGFFTHLAGIALGEPARGAARPSLPPRYAPSPASEAGLEAAPIESVPELPRPSQLPAAEPQAAAADPLPPGAAPVRSAAAPVLPRSPPRRAEPAVRTDRPHPPSRRTETAETVSTPVPAEVAARRIPPPAPLPARPVANAPPPADATPGEAAPIPMPEREPATVAAPERRSAPLSERVLAGRAPPPRQIEPVIHVTIDRIDVRQPAAPAPAPPARRPPAEPSITLSDLLRGGSPGTRQ